MSRLSLEQLHRREIQRAQAFGHMLDALAAPAAPPAPDAPAAPAHVDSVDAETDLPSVPGRHG